MRLELTGERPYGYDNPNVLNYYDGPLIMWLPVAGDTRYLAFSLFDFEDNVWPFLVLELSPEQAQALDDNKATLLATYHAAAARYLLKDYGAKELELEPLPELPDDYLPGDAYLRAA